jgi:hypothetical protein
MVDGIWNNDVLDPILDAKAAAFTQNNVNFVAGTVNTIKNYIAGRRTTLARMHALWRERFADRRAVMFLLTPDGEIELAELAVDPTRRPTLPPKILFALPE